MSLEEQKLKVCEKLPDIIFWSDTFQAHLWEDTEQEQSINWPTEGLQICHEAEKLLNENLRLTYWVKLSSFYADNARNAIFATYEQRLEALCRVWYPERFE